MQFPNGRREIYCKNYLHEGEDVFFHEGDQTVLIDIGQEKISLGICYDIEIQEHIEKAVNHNATIYASSIFYSNGGIEGLQQKAKDYADTYKIDFAISNYVGEIWNTQSGGKSMYWSKYGESIGMLDFNHNFL